MRDYTISRAQFAGYPGQAVALIRKRLQRRIVNGWLVTITALGAVIVVADGLTRPAKDWFATLLPPFDYNAHPASILFAAVTLPLLCAKRVRVSPEGFFLWFTFCASLYKRGFSCLRLPGAPLFVTDIVLVVFAFVAIHSAANAEGSQLIAPEYSFSSSLWRLASCLRLGDSGELASLCCCYVIPHPNEAGPSQPAGRWIWRIPEMELAAGSQDLGQTRFRKCCRKW